MLYTAYLKLYNNAMKIGVFGGTFDPVHLDHLAVIRGAIRALNLDKVLLMLTLNPPHKPETVTDYAVRREMLTVFAEESSLPLEIDDSEELFAPKAYAYQTLPYLKEKYDGDDLIYLIGSDSLFKFTEWKRPETVARSMPIAVYPRGDDLGVAEECDRLTALYPGSEFIPLPFVSHGISASLVRFMSETGDEEGLGRVLTPRVKQFIVDKRLYTDYRPIVEKLKAELPAGLFAHSLRSAEWAVTHAWLQGTGFKESFLAALLHDSAKPFSPMFPMDTYPVGTAKPVCHQYDGGYRVVHDFGITDPAIVDAVTYHTTARANMTKLDELVYLADKLEKGRNYPGVDELRAIGEKSVSDAVAASLKRSDEYLSGKGERPDALTLQAIEWYNQKNGRHNGT